MNRRGIAIIVACLTGVCLGLLIARHRSAPLAPIVITTPISDTNAARTHVVVRKQFFEWQELESSDYSTYVSNLHNIGCPEQTIHDIILADVNQLYAWKRLTEVPSSLQSWWLTSPDTNLVTASATKKAGLEQERRALLLNLLGANADIPDTVPHFDIQLTGPVLADIPTDTKRTVFNILLRGSERMQSYHQAASDGVISTSRGDVINLMQQTRVELSRALSPAQFEEFSLRYSAEASALRTVLSGVQVSPGEFHKLYGLYVPLWQQMVQLDPQTSTNTATIEKQYYDTFKSVLGPERFQIFRVQNDAAYRDAMTKAVAAGASSAVADQLYEIGRAATDEKNRILTDTNLTAEQQTEELKAMEQKQKAANDEVLGVAPAAPAEPPLPPQPPTPVPAAVHAYSPGETIDQIATEYGVSTKQILDANPNLNINNLARGASINIPQQQSQ